MKAQVGIILARFQPLHNGHMELIKKAYKENEEIYIFIGSSDKYNKRNPIPFQTRRKLVRAAIREEGMNMHINILPLPDLYGEHNDSYDWGFYLYANVVRTINQPSFKLYYGDSIDKISTWFPKAIREEYVYIQHVNRNEMQISSTMIRELIKTNQDISAFVPPIIIEELDIIKSFIHSHE